MQGSENQCRFDAGRPLIKVGERRLPACLASSAHDEIDDDVDVKVEADDGVEGYDVDVDEDDAAGRNDHPDRNLTKKRSPPWRINVLRTAGCMIDFVLKSGNALRLAVLRSADRKHKAQVQPWQDDPYLYCLGH